MAHSTSCGASPRWARRCFANFPGTPMGQPTVGQALLCKLLSRSGPFWGVTLFWVTFQLHVCSARQLLPFCTYNMRPM